ncbi:MAG: ABC transporter ATP-binding protein [Candidatus Thermoplasmatota archaeon]|nr:ABC transporter ATP-binding protein [Candidatus Thermoplasmatota archaeon]
MKDQLTVRSIHKSFGREQVLRDLSFDLGFNKILAILGPSGCGKSTILRVISGLISQDRGSVLIDGKEISGIPANKRGIGFVFQNYSLFPHMNVARNIEFGLKLKGVSSGKRRKKVSELLSLVDLDGFGNRRPSDMSGGQKQRVALARALAVDPKLLLLDEPFGALDAKIRRRIRRDLKRLQKEIGVSMLFVTHDQEEAFEVGDRIAVMNEGRFEQIGLPRDLYDNPKSRFVAKFVGNMNVIGIPDEKGINGIEVMVRPEDVVLTRKDLMPGSKGVNGTMVSYAFLGHFIEAKVLLENGEYLSAVMTKNEFERRYLRRGKPLKVDIKKFRTFKEPA